MYGHTLDYMDISQASAYTLYLTLVKFCEYCESSESCPLSHLETFGLVLPLDKEVNRIMFKICKLKKG